MFPIIVLLIRLMYRVVRLQVLNINLDDVVVKFHRNHRIPSQPVPLDNAT